MAPSAATQAKQKDLDRILEEVTKTQRDHEGKRWEPAVREKFEALCAEGDALQEDLKAESAADRFRDNVDRLRQVPNPTLPNSRNQVSGKMGPRDIAGFVSLGDLVLGSESFRAYAASNYATGSKATINIAAAMIGKNVTHGPRGEALVALNLEQRKAYESFMETKEFKAIPTLGAGVLDPDRVARIPQVTADERIRLRDIISTGVTSSSSIEYVREEAVTGDAAPVTHGQVKPELSIEYTLQSTPVRTVAGWIPVQNQQLEDWPQLRSLIDGRLRYKVSRAEEQQVFFGDGTPPNLEGLLTVSGTQNIATNGRYVPGTHTLIDVVRMGVTDVFLAGYEANAVAIHPVDWETILLEKGSDQRYVWAVVTDQNGSRIWGLRAVETVGLQDRNPAVGNPRRSMVVGDFAMGAQLLDRMDLTVQVGLVDDQFIRNMRTILAEERIALPIYAPAAFSYFDTAAGS